MLSDTSALHFADYQVSMRSPVQERLDAAFSYVSESCLSSGMGFPQSGRSPSLDSESLESLPLLGASIACDVQGLCGNANLYQGTPGLNT